MSLLPEDKKTADTSYNLGRLYYTLGNSDKDSADVKKSALLKADSVFAKVITLDPTNYRGYVWRARSNFSLDPETLQGLAKPFYEQTPYAELIDGQHLYRLQNQIDESGIIFEEEIEAFCEIYFKPRRTETVYDHAKMNGVLDKAVQQYNLLPEEKQEELKGLFVNFRNMYGFLSQVIPYQDTDLEKMYTYLRFLLTKLPRRASGPTYHLEDEVELQYYRLQKISEGQIDLKNGETHPIKGPTDVGTGKAEDEEIPLSELIDILNELYNLYLKDLYKENYSKKMRKTNITVDES